MRCIRRYEHGSACGAGGCEHASNAGGYYHGTSASNGTVSHTGYYGTSTASYGNYYHQPATVNYYGASGCYNCGGGGWGAAAAGVAVGTAVGVAAGAASSSAAYSAGVQAGYAAGAAPAAYAALPAGCVLNAAWWEYCGSTWLAPAYGANGVFYQVMPPP